MSKKNLNVSLRSSYIALSSNDEQRQSNPRQSSYNHQRDFDITKCPICISTLIEPVTLLCGHSFCKLCEISCHSNKDGIKQCALCRFSYSDEPKVNIVLHNILKQLLGDKYINKCIKRNSEQIKLSKSTLNFPNYPNTILECSTKITNNCLIIPDTRSFLKKV